MTEMVNGRSRGWWYPYIFVAGMTVVIIVNGFMIYKAVTTFSGLETERHYVKGLAYNQDLEAARRQAELAWTVEPAFVPDVPDGDTRPGQVRVSFRDRLGAPIEDVVVKAMFFRPTVRGFDVETDLVHLGGGVYGGTSTLPLPGQWDLRVHAWHGDDMVQVVRRIHVP